MNLFDNVAKTAQKAGKGRGASAKIGLIEIIVAHTLARLEYEKKVIADLLGVTVNVLNYKVFEKQATFVKKDKDGNEIGEETKCRSAYKFLYEDHTDPESGLVDGETFATRLFAAYGEEYTGQEQIDQMVEQWKEDNGFTEEEAEEEPTEEEAPEADEQLDEELESDEEIEAAS